MSICKNPFNGAAGLYGCGQCMPCLFNKRRVWTQRLLLEGREHEDNCFVTLTYDDEHLPAGGNLDPKATRYFLDRLRKYVGYGKIRFYLCGEYGPRTFRPHYHIALFGYGPCEYGQTRTNVRGAPRSDCCVSCSLLHALWGKGSVVIGEFTEDSAQYVCGYVTNKMASGVNPRLRDRVKEFTQSSRRNGGGIGAPGAYRVAETLKKINLDQRIADVPSALRHGKRMLPLGRYMKGKIREALSREVTVPKEVQLKNSRKMLPLQARASLDPDSSLKKEYLKETAGTAASIEARMKLSKIGKDKL